MAKFNEIELKTETPKPTRPITSISRSESFEQQSSLKLSGGKRRKRDRSSSSCVIAGNVGSGIGSTRNITSDEKCFNFENKKTQSSEILDKQRQLNGHMMTRHISADRPLHQVNIPVNRVNYFVENPDPKVAARLASNDCLQYD